jgi:hypothetical protein
MNSIFEYILIGILLILIVKLLYDSYKFYYNKSIINKLKKMFKPYKSWFILEDSITNNQETDNYSINSSDSNNINSNYSNYSSYNYSENENDCSLRKTGYPFNDEGYPINLDKSLKSLLNNCNNNTCDSNSDSNSNSNSNDNNYNYMNSQLNFNDKINGTSKDAPDAVDKIVEYQLNGGVNKTTKIQDVYNNLTSSPY